MNVSFVEGLLSVNIVSLAVVGNNNLDNNVQPFVVLGRCWLTADDAPSDQHASATYSIPERRTTSDSNGRRSQ